MKSKRIILSKLDISEGSIDVINVPILNAYAIEYWDFSFNGVAGYYSWVDIDGANVEITAKDFSLEPNEIYELIVYYHGVRDYESLFPFVVDRHLKLRMAQFYEDAEKCFESSAWLPFLLMCGGIFEGVLLSQGVMAKSFSRQIDIAKEREVISDSEKNIMGKVREGRNMVHAGKNHEKYVSRADAMDIRKVLDKMIERFCVLPYDH